MSIDDIKPPSSYIQSPTTTIQNTQTVEDASTMISQANMGIRVISLMQGVCSLLIIIGLIVGVIYMIKSKKNAWKKILIGVVIILVPFIINLILSMIKFNMLLNV